ncbi:MAG: START-like domain-containing protein [Luteibaculaceae bacterium]
MSSKIKFEREYLIKSSPNILFNTFSTPSGLSEWFCDDVNLDGDIYTFIWDGSEDEARLLTSKKNSFVKFRWLYNEEEDDDAYFEFRIKVDSLTNEVALVITDFSDEDELEENKQLWDKQVDTLKNAIGG